MTRPDVLTDDNALLPDPEAMTFSERLRYVDRASFSYIHGRITMETYCKVQRRYWPSIDWVSVALEQHAERRRELARPWWRRWLS